MKKILFLAIGLLFIIGICLKNAKVNSKEIELADENIGNLYKEYVITKSKDGMKLNDYFNNKNFFIETNEVQKIFVLKENYELLQLQNKIYLKKFDEIKLKKGVLGTKVGTNYMFKENDKFGILDENLNVLANPVYDGLFKGEKSNLLLAKENDKFGYLNFDGTIIIPFEYEMGASEKNGLMVVKKDNKIGVINQKNKTVIDFNYDGIYYYNPTKFVAIRNKEYFLIDILAENIEKIDASWMGVQKDKKLFYEKDEKFGIFDFKKGDITGNIYDQLSQDYYELIIAMKDNKYGLISNDGEVKLPFTYDYILPVGKNYFKAGNDSNSYLSLINSKGKIISKQNYDDFIELNKNNIIGINNEELTLINNNGKELKQLDSIIKFNDKVLLYKKNGKNILREL